MENELLIRTSDGIQLVDTQAVPGGRLGPNAVFFYCGHSFDEDTCARSHDTGDFVCSICQTDPEKMHVRRTAPPEEVSSSSSVHSLTIY